MREEILAFNSVEVRVRRRRGQRSLKVHVRSSGEIFVTAGYSLPAKAIVRFLGDSWDWVERAKQRALIERAKHPPVEFRQGDEFLFMGSLLKLTFVAGSRASREISRAGNSLEAQVPPKEWLGFEPHAPHLDWRTPIRRYYQSEAETVLTERVNLCSSLMKVRPTRLIFRCQRTRWGSCGPDGCVSLNWRLIAAPLEVIDYVVIHELAHLTHPNHSVRFWRHVEQFCPAPKACVKWLRQNHRHFGFLLPTPRSD